MTVRTYTYDDGSYTFKLTVRQPATESSRTLRVEIERKGPLAEKMTIEGPNVAILGRFIQENT